MLNHFSSFEAYLAKRRLAISTRALIQEPVAICETLGVRGGVMGKRSNERKRVLWRGVRSSEDASKRETHLRSPHDPLDRPHSGNPSLAPRTRASARHPLWRATCCRSS